MKITLSYNGKVYGSSFTPIYLLTLGEELIKAGVEEVTLIREGFNPDVQGIPADSIFSEDYQKIVRVIESLSGKKIDYKELDVDYEWLQPADVAGVLTAFGCVYKCKFCPHTDMEWIPRSMDKVLKDLDYVTSHYNYFEFIDNNIMADKKRFFEIIRHIPNGVKWGALINVAHYDKQDLEYLKRYGCVNLYTGIETFNEDDLNYFGKPYYSMGIDPKLFLKQLKDLGFNVYAFLIQGLPNEIQEDFSSMLSWLNENEIYYSIGNFYNSSGVVKKADESPTSLKARIERNNNISEQSFTKFMKEWL
jgi:radical SAM superfamily enzyme YgiQ (UPF0313 family)